MGKRGKNHGRQRPQRLLGGDDENSSDSLPSSAYNLSDEEGRGEGGGGEESGGEESGGGGDDGDDWVASPSKFDLYQKSVQLPRGDISYMQKFFLIYVGGRLPIHLQEDFCGTALLSTEWLRGDPRRTAVGLDLDLEALEWCTENNLNKIGSDVSSRMSLFHGNVLQPQEACLIRNRLQDLNKDVVLNGQEELWKNAEPTVISDSAVVCPSDVTNEVVLKKKCSLPARDIICAFNYSCCCLQNRADLILYFKHALDTLSKRSGIFVMDLYGGTSSERKLRLQRRFSNFTYTWEQGEFDIINRRTKISLHFHFGKKQVLRHAFSYNWRLWTLPEVKDCLEEAGFGSVHFWIRQENVNLKEIAVASSVKYEEVSSFQQIDAWNVYIVAVAN